MGRGDRKKHQKRRIDQTSALSSIIRWATLYSKHQDSSCPSADSSLAEWLPSSTTAPSSSPSSLVVDLHSHSTCSDGMLSPVQLVEKAFSRGVQVLALTDHDTLAGMPKAIEAANKYRIRIIPGVEISARVTSGKGGFQEPVHILGYYSCCGPVRWQELERALARVREGRYHRAQAIVNKLSSLKKPVKWERVLAMAGDGVAPGRVHIARALVEAGHVNNLKEAFSRYLHDGGPAYATGYEMAAEDAVRLICDTGGIAAVAHPWCLKDPFSVVRKLKDAGLHGVEVYRGDGAVNGFAALAESCGLLKLGGSDFHGRGDPDELQLGKVSLPPVVFHKFLLAAQPIWLSSIEALLENFSQEIFEINSGKIAGLKYFPADEILKGDISYGYATVGGKQKAFMKLSPWLTEMERISVKDKAIQLKLNLIEEESEDGKVTYVISQQN